MHKGIRLRLRLYLMILPLVMAAISLSGVLASLESRVALTRLANRLMAFKAEQLQNYFDSEWRVVEQLGLAKDPAYQAAVEASLRSYAVSLLRSETEMIVAFDNQGTTVMQIGFQTLSSGNTPQRRSAEAVKLAPGWFTRNLLGEDRVGVAFALEPLGWTVAVTELEPAFFSDVRTMQFEQLSILIGSLVVAAFFLSIFIGHILRPAERLTATIERITVTNDLASRAEIEFTDEIGTLAREFNTMVSNLQANYRRLEAASQAEKQARQLAVEREAETLFLLGRVSDFRDLETGAHLRRIGSLAVLLAALLGMGEEDQKLIANSAPLHDIGKLAVPESILLKPGKLSPEESKRMQAHTTFGHELLKDARSIYLIEGAKIALTHHEKWDGTGYPAGLKGEDIPLSGRIVSIVDVFDALTSSRPYKEAWSFESVRDYIAEQRGKHFDPRLAELVLENFGAFQERIVGSAEAV
jgi:response regulator RpfG family c-di-GMP phosphodiesterase